jgi:hypothetical protein
MVAKAIGLLAWGCFLCIVNSTAAAAGPSLNSGFVLEGSLAFSWGPRFISLCSLAKRACVARPSFDVITMMAKKKDRKESMGKTYGGRQPKALGEGLELNHEKVCTQTQHVHPQTPSDTV